MDYVVLRTDVGPQSGKTWQLRFYENREHQYWIFQGDKEMTHRNTLGEANKRYESIFENKEGGAPSPPPAA